MSKQCVQVCRKEGKKRSGRGCEAFSDEGRTTNVTRKRLSYYCSIGDSRGVCAVLGMAGLAVHRIDALRRSTHRSIDASSIDRCLAHTRLSVQSIPARPLLGYPHITLLPRQPAPTLHTTPNTQAQQPTTNIVMASSQLRQLATSSLRPLRSLSLAGRRGLSTGAGSSGASSSTGGWAAGSVDVVWLSCFGDPVR